MKTSLKIPFYVGFFLLVSGMIFKFAIQFMAGSIIELRTLEATLTMFILFVSGLIMVSIGLVYKQFGSKMAR
jgi:amino acid transporter